MKSNKMKHIFWALLFVTSGVFGQDYILDEDFEPTEFNDKNSEDVEGPKFSFFYEYGMNWSSDGSFIRPWGSNFHYFHLDYFSRLSSNVKWVTSLGYYSDQFNLMPDPGTYFHEGEDYDKRKLISQNVVYGTGIQFGEQKVLQLGVYAANPLFTTYRTKDESENMIRKFKKLDYMVPFVYGFQVKGGWDNFYLHFKYRLSDLLDGEVIEVPKFTLGTGFKIGS